MNPCPKGTIRKAWLLLVLWSTWCLVDAGAVSAAPPVVPTEDPASQSDEQNGQSTPTPTAKSDNNTRKAKTVQSGDKLGRSDKDGISSLAGKKGDANRMLWQMLASVLIIAVLGAAAYFAVRRFAPRFRLTPKRSIHLMETLPLGARKSLHLVEVAGKKLLLGSCRESISILTELDAESPSPRANEESKGNALLPNAKAQNASGKFASALKEQMQ